MTYLDITELAALLGLSENLIKKKVRTDPNAIPSKMHLPGSQMLRWRLHEVENWMAETNWTRSTHAGRHAKSFALSDAISKRKAGEFRQEPDDS